MRIIPFILIGIVLMASCSEDSLDAIPMEQSFEEPSEALARYVQKLHETQTGWEFGLVGNGKQAGFYTGYLDFDQKNTARFTVDANAPENTELTETDFHTDVVGTNPRLVFSTGAFAQFATARDGLDTAFTFQAIRKDTIYLMGNQYGSQLKLVKASPAKAQAYREGGVLSVMASLEIIQQLPRYFKRMTVNGAAYDLHFRPDTKYLYIHYGGTDRFAIHETPYSLTATGIYLQKPLIDGINQIDYIDEFSVDIANMAMTARVGGQPAVFTNEAAPAAYDPQAPARFFSHPPHQMNFLAQDGSPAPQFFSASFNGFTVAGVPDAYGVKNIPGYQFMSFFHQFDGQGYGGLRFFLEDSLGQYGPAVVRQFLTPDHRIRFAYYGHFGVPPDDIAPIIASVTQTFTEETGFYVIKSGPASYDLVAASDGTKWIRFE